MIINIIAGIMFLGVMILAYTEIKEW